MRRSRKNNRQPFRLTRDGRQILAEKNSVFFFTAIVVGPFSKMLRAVLRFLISYPFVYGRRLFHGFVFERGLFSIYILNGRDRTLTSVKKQNKRAP